MNDIIPEDDLDEICKTHDNCYERSADTISCDESIVAALRSLDPDPTKWTNQPKTLQDIEYAQDYVKAAESTFHYLAKAKKMGKMLGESGVGLREYGP